jgi:hypothetical protein
MNLPKQSRPVIRDVSRDPIRPRVEGAQIIGGHRNPLLAQCLEWCLHSGYDPQFQAHCRQTCFGTYGHG